MNKNKISFIDGTLPKPDRFDPTFDAWEKCNNQVHTWIMNSVSPNIAHSILHIENAHTTWNKLKHRFAQADSVRIADLQLEVYLLKQDSLSVTDFFTQLTVIWEELENLSPIPQCTCPVKCAYDPSKYIEQTKERDFIMRFLTGLNENFAPCKSQILMMDPIPSIDRAFSIVIQYERQNHLCLEHDEDQAVINAVDGRKSYGRGQGSFSNKMCTYCGKSGHTVETCYRKNGYPLGFKFKNGNVVVACTDKPEETDDTKSVKDQGSTFTQEEYKLLRSLLQTKTTADSQPAASPSQACSIIRSSQDEDIHLANHSATCCSLQNNLDDWIIDSGATDHICSSLKWFCSYKKIHPISVRLPNGSLASADYAGDVLLNGSILLHEVLYLPAFCFNLLALSKLTKTLNYCFSFSGESCVIQDSSKKMIGLGKMVHGLYLLNHTCNFSEKNIVSLCNSVSIPESVLWHFRLGHASSSKLESLCKQIPIISFNKNAICDVCHFAKQRRLPFLLAIVELLISLTCYTWICGVLFPLPHFTITSTF